MCDSGKDETLVPVYRVRPNGERVWLVLETFDAVKDEIDNAGDQDGEYMEVQRIKMKRCDIEAMPELDAW